MKKITIGIMAHVDAGKTTLSERILFEAGAIRKAGRVDTKDTVFDTNEIEKERGITVFADQYTFHMGEDEYTLVDTPGHLDFAAEAERPMPALDAAVLVIDGAGGVRAHTVTLFRMARRFELPVLLFINKCDQVAFSLERTLSQIREKLDSAIVPVKDGAIDEEALAETYEEFLEKYLSGTATEKDAWAALAKAYQAGKAFPVFIGSALTGEGVKEFLNALAKLQNTCIAKPDREYDAIVYKVRYDKKQTRMVFVRLFSGSIKPRDAFTFIDENGEEISEKAHEIRHVLGENYVTLDEAKQGDCVALTGLSMPKPGDLLTLKDGKKGRLENTMRYSVAPTLSSRVVALDGTDDSTLLGKLRILEDEEPLYKVYVDEVNRTVNMHVMGTVQLEVLEKLIPKRFGIQVRFEKPKVLYLETIAAPVLACGHYEPLRHYAEVILRLEPGQRGSGITFESNCHVDVLTANYQNLIRTHVFEKTHKGILTGSPLTDVKVILQMGRAHLKHTEGGDFREATYRAIRQGLEHAENVLLEPYYRYEIAVPQDCAGRVMNDITLMHGSYDTTETVGSEIRICGRGPVSTFMEYQKELLSFTKGTGQALFAVDGYEICHNADEVIKEIGYNKDGDVANPSSSVFCSHGAGFMVPWYEAESYMHTLK